MTGMARALQDFFFWPLPGCSLGLGLRVSIILQQNKAGTCRLLSALKASLKTTRSV